MDLPSASPPKQPFQLPYFLQQEFIKQIIANRDKYVNEYQHYSEERKKLSEDISNAKIKLSRDLEDYENTIRKIKEDINRAQEQLENKKTKRKEKGRLYKHVKDLHIQFNNVIQHEENTLRLLDALKIDEQIVNMYVRLISGYEDIIRDLDEIINLINNFHKNPINDRDIINNIELKIKVILDKIANLQSHFIVITKLKIEELQRRKRLILDGKNKFNDFDPIDSYIKAPPPIHRYLGYGIPKRGRKHQRGNVIPLFPFPIMPLGGTILPNPIVPLSNVPPIYLEDYFKRRIPRANAKLSGGKKRRPKKK
jgi:hypothetical protein